MKQVNTLFLYGEGSRHMCRLGWLWGWGGSIFSFSLCLSSVFSFPLMFLYSFFPPPFFASAALFCALAPSASLLHSSWAPAGPGWNIESYMSHMFLQGCLQAVWLTPQHPSPWQPSSFPPSIFAHTLIRLTFRVSCEQVWQFAGCYSTTKSVGLVDWKPVTLINKRQPWSFSVDRDFGFLLNTHKWQLNPRKDFWEQEILLKPWRINRRKVHSPRNNAQPCCLVSGATIKCQHI